MKELYQQASTLAYQKFQETKELLLSFTLFNDSDEVHSFIDSIEIAFYADSSTDTLAKAIHESRVVLFNVALLGLARRVIVHEFAHLIVKHFKLPAGHCLEFAIINYSIYMRLFVESDQSQMCFFRSYDVHEDSTDFSINPSKFDSFIKSITFESLEELAAKAKKLACEIREKSPRRGYL